MTYCAYTTAGYIHVHNISLGILKIYTCTLFKIYGDICRLPWPSSPLDALSVDRDSDRFISK